MSAPKDEMHALIDSLSDEVAADLLPELQRLHLRWEAREERRPAARPWPPAWFGSVSGSSSDVASRSEEILREELGQRSCAPGGSGLSDLH
ncbi:hypothetical protein ACFTSF_16215 [Kribbella sp. NPDC056951]|uniref:hypothetical protein n=1 Tax=Kribbella sp. NPDC056951 TaxID=3345978 RepID=UPI003631A2F4